MALSQINTYSNVGNSSIDNNMLTQNKLMIGHDKLTISNIGNTTVPAIEQGSIFETGGALFQATTNVSVSLTDPHTSTTVANGKAYIFINGSDGEPYFTATAPTWSDDKQGWYGTSTYANYRYVMGFCIDKISASYYKGIKCGTLDDRTPYYMKEISITITNGNTDNTGSHYISSAYTNDRIFNVWARTDSGTGTAMGTFDSSSVIIYYYDIDNTSLTITRGGNSTDKTFKCKIWYT